MIAFVGVRLTAIVDQIADRTGLGEALAGSIFLGAATSLSGIVVSTVAAYNGKPELAMSNALGGIAVQTAFLAVADMFYRRANLEHAAASVANMMQCSLLLFLLSGLLLASYTPEWTIMGVHPATPILFISYVYGLRHANKLHDHPMWRPVETSETKVDEPEPQTQTVPLWRLWLQFFLLAAIIGSAGWVLEGVASRLASVWGISHTAVGILLTSVTTSLPELVTSIAAVRRGALTLAVSGIIGGNAFDTLFAAVADIAYQEGSIYHAIPDRVLFWTTLSILMTAVVLMGLIRRERQGPGGIGFESAVVLMLYGFGVMMLAT